MRTTAHRNWNRTFGIDSSVPIAEKDRKEIDALYSSDDNGRTRSGYVHPSFVLPYLPASGVLVLGGAAVIFGRLPIWTMAIAMAVALVLYIAGSAWICRTYGGPLYRRELRQRGYDICLNCGYWLRGLGDEAVRCPECGAPRESK